MPLTSVSLLVHICWLLRKHRLPKWRNDAPLTSPHLFVVGSAVDSSVSRLVRRENGVIKNYDQCWILMLSVMGWCKYCYLCLNCSIISFAEWDYWLPWLFHCCVAAISFRTFGETEDLRDLLNRQQCLKVFEIPSYTNGILSLCCQLVLWIYPLM